MSWQKFKQRDHEGFEHIDMGKVSYWTEPHKVDPKLQNSTWRMSFVVDGCQIFLGFKNREDANKAAKLFSDRLEVK